MLYEVITYAGQTSVKKKSVDPLITHGEMMYRGVEEGVTNIFKLPTGELSRNNFV